MSIVLATESQLSLDAVNKESVRVVIRAWLEKKWTVHTQLEKEGYSDFQIELLAAVFEESRKDKGEVGKVFSQLDVAIQTLFYPGTYYHREVDVYWNNQNLVFHPRPTH